MTVLNSSNDALALLKRLGAPARLITHLELVGEAGNQVTATLDQLGVAYDKPFVEIGIALHDAGKIDHPEELDQSGNLHEAAGETLLLVYGVDPKLARCCRSHAQYNTMDVSLEELLIALADNLWKGKRASDLELRIIDEIAARLKTDRWSIFYALDTCFEKTAASGDARLSRSI